MIDGLIESYMMEHGEIQNKNVQELLEVKRTAALNTLNTLVEKNFIKQVGKGRGNKYILKK